MATNPSKPTPIIPGVAGKAEGAPDKEAEKGTVGVNLPRGPAAEPAPAEPEKPDYATQTLEQARARSKSGNVFVVTADILGCPVPVGGIAADVDLPPNSDPSHLMRVGALTPAEPLKSDPSAGVRTAEHLEELDALQARCERLDNENDRLSAENTRLTAELERLKK